MTTSTQAATLPVPARAARCSHCGAPVRTARADRKFTLLDAMILVVASALAFAVLRPLFGGVFRHGSAWSRYFAVFMGGLVGWTPALLILQLRSPRPSIRRLFRRPGFAATVVGTTVLSLGVLMDSLNLLVRVLRRTPPVPAGTPARVWVLDPSWWLGVVFHFGPSVGPAVIAAWVLLAVSGRRRPSPSWSDVAGRAIGTAWIGVFAFYCFAQH